MTLDPPQLDLSRRDLSRSGPATRLVHGGIQRSHHGETAEALFLTSG